MEWLLYTAVDQDDAGGQLDNAAFYDSESGLCTKLPTVRVVEACPKKHGSWDDTGVTITYPKRQCNTRLLLLLFSAIILFLLVATIATVAYLAVGEARMTWDEEQEYQEGNTGISLVIGQLRITNRVFTKDLLNANSPSFHKLTAQIRQSLDAVFIQSGLAPYYNETGVTGYSEGSVIVRCQIHLSIPRHDATHLVGMAVIQALERYHGYLPGGILQVDIRSLHFTGLLDQESSTPEATTSEALRLPVALWSPWSAWSPCLGNCEVQTRYRECHDEHGRKYPPELNGHCSEDGSVSREIRDCPCDNTTITSTEQPAIVRSAEEECAGNCDDNQVCLMLSQTPVARCLVPRDASDPTGCGGWCVGDHQLCRHVGNGTFQCIDNPAACNDETREWKCGNGLCILSAQRCDGHLDCYDMSDEFNCECDGYKFHCGNDTSCLPMSKRCNGEVDCWDGSDEINCTELCPVNEYTCNSGRCIDKLRFCDGYADCDDSSDEPQGCSAPCLHTQNRCNNGRCVNALLWCNGVDNCGDESDESACDSPHLLQMKAPDQKFPHETVV